MTAYRKISIIIPNFHSPIINHTLDSLLSQVISIPYEILIVGQDKYGIIEKYKDKGIKFMQTTEPTPPAIARNIGADSSTGDYLIFIDSDCIAADEFLQKHLKANDDKLSKMVGGAVSIDFDQDYWILSDNIATFHETLSHTEPGERDILPSLNLSLSKILWDQIGGFDITFPKPAGEDADFSYRARQLGAQLFFSPDAKIEHHHPRGSLKLIIQHAYNFGKYSIKINPKYASETKIPKIIIRNNWMFIFLSPLLALSVIFKILFTEKLPAKYWHTLPAIYIAKIAWCFGAATRKQKL